MYSFLQDGVDCAGVRERSFIVAVEGGRPVGVRDDLVGDLLVWTTPARSTPRSCRGSLGQPAALAAKLLRSRSQDDKAVLEPGPFRQGRSSGFTEELVPGLSSLVF